MQNARSEADRSATTAKQRDAGPPFPEVIWQRGRGYVFRNALETYKSRLLAASLGVQPVLPTAVYPDPLVPLKVVGMELGLGRRTIGRRISESRADAQATEGRAA